MLDLAGGADPAAAPLALARKWRPHKFADLVGQEHVVRALTGALASGRFHHAFMFTGTRGIGKTTLARILAKGFNCEQLADGEPCGNCDQCSQVDSGSHPDVIELDAASTTQVDSMRSLLESALYAPALARYKVYIIDEVHMLSRHSFNAMLKTLEEPPDHVKFILATTDPQLVPATVQSRCLRFSLRRLPIDLIVAQLEHILAAEGHSYAASALTVIANHADGSMRDALSILDEALAGGNEVEEERVRDLVGAAGPDQAPELLGCLLANDGAGLLARTTALHEQARVLDRICTELVALLHEAQLVAVAPELAERAHPVVVLAAQQLDEIQLQVAYEVASQGSAHINTAPSAKAALDMTLLRILALIKTGGKPAAAAAPASTSAAPAPRAKPGKPAKPATPVAPPPAAKQEAAAPTTPPPASSAGNLPSDEQQWQQLCQSLQGPAAALANECVFARVAGTRLWLHLKQEKKALLRQQNQLQKTLRKHYQADTLKVEIDVAGAALKTMTPSEVKQEEANEHQRQKKAALEATAESKLIKEVFPEATVVPDDS